MTSLLSSLLGGSEEMMAISSPWDPGVRRNGSKLCWAKFRLDMRRHFFVERWSRAGTAS